SQDGISLELANLLQQALTISLDLASPRLFAHTLFNTASLAILCGNYLQAALLIGANEAYREIHHLPMSALALAADEERRTPLREELGENAFQVQLAHGKQLEEPQIVKQMLATLILTSREQTTD
ncbi:MAG: hypothetical protein JWN14_2839, partial [Chthonomonadales bacterium]|nr:hypothetical protein [Chthonomonadales bacterium]